MVELYTIPKELLSEDHMYLGLVMEIVALCDTTGGGIFIDGNKLYDCIVVEQE